MFLKHVLEEFSEFHTLLAQLYVELVDRVMRRDVWTTVALAEVLGVRSVVLATVSTYVLATKLALPRKRATELAVATVLAFVVPLLALM